MKDELHFLGVVLFWFGVIIGLGSGTLFKRSDSYNTIRGSIGFALLIIGALLWIYF